MGTLNVGTVNAGAGVQLPSYATTNLPTGGIQQGFLAYDSTIGCVKVWNGQKWQKLDEATVNASGVIVSTTVSNTGSGYTATSTLPYYKNADDYYCCC